MSLTNYERETVILYNNEEQTADVSTYHPALIKKLDKLCADFPDAFHCYNRGEHQGAAYAEHTIPKCRVAIRTPIKLTEEKRAERAEKMRGMRKKARKVKSAPSESGVLHGSAS